VPASFRAFRLQRLARNLSNMNRLLSESLWIVVRVLPAETRLEGRWK
jgi:hypothetical protein